MSGSVNVCGSVEPDPISNNRLGSISCIESANRRERLERI